MRQSLIGLLCLFVLSSLGNSNAQQACSPVCPPSIAEWQGESSEVIQRLLLRRARTVFLEVQLEQDVLDNSGTAERRTKMALKRLDYKVFSQLSSRLKAVKNRKDADLLFVLVEGNSLQEFGHTAIKEKLVVFPANPMDGDLGPLWESHWYKGKFEDPDDPVYYAVKEFESLFDSVPPEAWIGAARPNYWQHDDESPSVDLTAKERRDLLLSAKTVAVLSFGRPGSDNSFPFGGTPPFEFPDERKAYLAIETGLRTWYRFSIVKDPAKADLLFLIHVWNEKAEKSGRVQHQFLMSRLSIYRGQAQFGKAQQALWSAVEKAYTGNSTKKVFQRFRGEIDDLEKGPALE